MKEIHCVLIRHGRTRGNQEKRYIGCRTDEALEPSCVRELDFAKDFLAGQKLASDVFVSPLKRCKETAEILTGESNLVEIADFREIDFGDFEGKNYRELNGNPVYQAWIDSNGELPFPNGENKAAFINRNSTAFLEVLKKLEKANTPDDTLHVFVVHGGSIMAILSTLTGKEYFDFQVDCTEGYLICVRMQEGEIHDLSYHRLCGGSST